eukprot:scaffold60998_cov30-Phaeocystis_antarctica.AAC.2
MTAARCPTHYGPTHYGYTYYYYWFSLTLTLILPLPLTLPPHQFDDWFSLTDNDAEAPHEVRRT